MANIKEKLETEKISRKAFLKGLFGVGVGAVAVASQAIPVLAQTISDASIDSKGVWNLDADGDGSTDVIFDSHDLDELKKQLEDSGGVYINTSAPTNKNMLWINPSDGTTKYWDGSAWVYTRVVWG